MVSLVITPNSLNYSTSTTAEIWAIQFPCFFPNVASYVLRRACEYMRGRGLFNLSRRLLPNSRHCYSYGIFACIWLLVTLINALLYHFRHLYVILAAVVTDANPTPSL